MYPHGLAGLAVEPLGLAVEPLEPFLPSFRRTGPDLAGLAVSPCIPMALQARSQIEGLHSWGSYGRRRYGRSQILLNSMLLESFGLSQFSCEPHSIKQRAIETLQAPHNLHAEMRGLPPPCTHLHGRGQNLPKRAFS